MRSLVGNKHEGKFTCYIFKILKVTVFLWSAKRLIYVIDRKIKL